MSNEHFGYAAPEGRRRAVQAIKRLIRKNVSFALYKGDAADAVHLYTNVLHGKTL